MNTLLDGLPFAVRVADDHEAMSRRAAAQVIEAVRAKPDTLLCLATGASPERTYALLAEAGQKDPSLFTRLRVLTLDEWYGLAPTDPASCQAYLRQRFLDPLGISSERFFAWHNQCADIPAECERVRRWLVAHGPIDLSILGLGLNGHLGFNEPAELLPPGPHRAELSTVSKEHAMLEQSSGAPAFGLTLGLADLLRSRQIFLLVSGARKSTQLARLLTGGLSTHFPASLLWLHPALTVFCDRSALGALGASSS